MPLLWFEPPVVIEANKAGERYAVTNVEGAAEYLLAWRGEGPRRPAWSKAVQACMSVAKGDATPEAVRVAFEAAARECGRLCEAKPNSNSEV